MSTILAVKENNTYWIGCDAQVSSGTSKILSKDKKYRIKSNYIVGIAGTLRIANEIYEKLPNKLDNIKEIEEIVLETKFNENTSFEAIIIFDDELYTIDNDKVLIKLSYCNFGVGSGGEYAMAAYRALSYVNGQNCEKNMLYIANAIKAASTIDSYTSNVVYVDYINLLNGSDKK